MGTERRSFLFCDHRSYPEAGEVAASELSKLEACLLSCSTLNSLVRLLPTSEYDLWVQEMTIAGLDFKNPVGMETFNCFIMVCIIELNRVLKI